MVLGEPLSFTSQPRLNTGWPELSALCYVPAKVIIHAIAHRAQNVLSTLQRYRAIRVSIPKSWYVSVHFRQSSHSSLSLLPSHSAFPGLCYLSSHLENQNNYLVLGNKNLPQHLSSENNQNLSKRNTSRLWVQFPLVAWWVENSPFTIQPFQVLNRCQESSLPGYSNG